MTFWRSSPEERAPLRSREDTTYGDNTNQTQSEQPERPEATIAHLTQRTRCLFSILTAPIPPVIVLVCMTLVWLIVQSARFWRQECRNLQAYAVCSAVLAVYTPFHYRHRRIPRVFVRQWDQCFHTIVVFYIYAGLTLVQTCRRASSDVDMEGKMTESSMNNNRTDDNTLNDNNISENQCEASCPEIYQALSIYVWTLQGLIVCLVLPLLCLPLIYVWFVRRSGGAQTHLNELLREQLHDDELVSNNGRVPVTQVLETLKTVQLLVDGTDRIWAFPRGVDAESTTPTLVKGVAECCICMEMFDTVRAIEQDVEAGATDNRRIVQAPDCGHLFHCDCIAGWVGGQWQEGNAERRARRTTCPLCRADLRPNHQ